MDTLKKETFPSKRKNKLMSRAEVLFEVLEKINDNAYKVDLLGDYGVSATFNVADLSTYQADDHLVDLRIKSLQQGRMMESPSAKTWKRVLRVQQGPMQVPKSKLWLKFWRRAKLMQPGLNSQKIPNFVHLNS